jgi:ABC-type Fe3+ transport system permease subunit
MRFYYVEEMLASLLLFAVLFSCLAVVLFLLSMVGRASEVLIAYAESWGRKVLHRTYLWRVSDPGPRI